MKTKSLLVILLLVSFGVLAKAKTSVDKVEPLFWWVGMKNPNLQLLVYGKGISTLSPSLTYEGVDIKQVIHVKNPNYIFIDLYISPQAKAGSFDILFKSGKKVVHKYKYELKDREKGSAERQGFNSSEVMYLVTPDRFANGNPDNDSVEGMVEKVDRTIPLGRHGGDLKGIIDHLDYIEQMGFKSLWVCPVLENNSPKASYHGYAITDFYHVDPRFGSNEQYKELSKKAKEKGIKLVIDLVANHCGIEHWWMKDLPTDDWLNFQEKPQFTNHQKTVMQDPYASDIDYQLLVDGWFVETMPDLNQRNELMATYLIQNSIWWVEYADLGGIRMDTYPYPDRDFMTEWARQIMIEYPNFNIVGEEWNPVPSTVAFWQRGKVNPNGYVSYLPTVMDFPIQETLKNALTADESEDGFGSLYRMLSYDYLYADPFNMLVFSDNHDMSRFYTQVNEDFELFKMGMAYILTIRGIPQVYYGTETLIANPGTEDHGVIRSDFQGGWDGDKVNAFNGKGLTDKQKEAQSFIKKMVNWRNSKKVIHHGKTKHFTPYDNIYVYFRYDAEETVMVIMNRQNQDVDLAVDRFKEILAPFKSGKDVISGNTFNVGETLKVPKKSALVLELK